MKDDKINKTKNYYRIYLAIVFCLNFFAFNSVKGNCICLLKLEIKGHQKINAEVEINVFKGNMNFIVYQNKFDKSNDTILLKLNQINVIKTILQKINFTEISQKDVYFKKNYIVYDGIRTELKYFENNKVNKALIISPLNSIKLRGLVQYKNLIRKLFYFINLDYKKFI